MKRARVTQKHIPRIGTRMTSARKEILDAITAHRGPFTIGDIVMRVGADEASVYRTIALLKEKEYLGVIDYPDGSRRYEVTHDHHHHIICTSCGYTEHLRSDSEPSLPRTEGTHFAQISDHEVTYYGMCAKCA